MRALDVIREVEELGGQFIVEGSRLRVRAPKPLPDTLMREVADRKLVIMMALDEHYDETIRETLEALRPDLPAPLQKLADDRLLILVSWHVISSWEATLRRLREDEKAKRSHTGRR